ncbi:MAG: protein kinase [Kofleriaceae bacterium]|nr:protein kinase [Kofleriaceae bacterium]
MAERDLVGTLVVGRYRVVDRLASGATADVYEAEHVELGTRVALKVLHAEHADSEVAARFLREGKTLAMFRHRNIVELLEVGRLDDGTLFLATELVRGLALRTLMSGGPVEPRRALGITRQVLDALGQAHAMGVIHRDIRPENILIANDGGQDLVKMLDFGVAKLVADTQTVLGEAKLTQAGMTAFGDPRYIAPECVVGGTVDARADLYSMGAVLYELLAGQPPFADADPSTLMRLHTYAAAPRLDQRGTGRTFTPQIEHVVGEALAKKPDLRFASATEMATAVDAAIHSLPVATPAPEPLSRPPDDSFHLHVQDLLQRPPPPTEHSQPLAAPGHAPLPQKPTAVHRLLELARQHRMIVAAVGGTLVLVLVVIIAVASGGSSSDAKATSPDLVKRATALVNAGTPKEAIDLLETELAEPAKPGDASAYLLLGHARFAAGRRLDALAAYERAIVLAPKLAEDAQLRANATAIVDGKDAVDAVVALEILATRVKPRADDLVLTVAATAKLPDVRRRAQAIAEREGLAARLDRVASLSLDLAQATTCEDRRTVIGKLRATADKRAVAPLKRAKVYKCVEREAADAIAELETK